MRKTYQFYTMGGYQFFIRGNDSLSCAKCHLGVFVRDTRAADGLDNDRDLRVIEDFFLFVCYQRGKRTIRKLTDIKDLLDLKFFAETLGDPIFIHFDDLGYAAADNTES